MRTYVWATIRRLPGSVEIYLWVSVSRINIITKDDLNFSHLISDMKNTIGSVGKNATKTDWERSKRIAAVLTLFSQNWSCLGCTKRRRAGTFEGGKKLPFTCLPAKVF